jgi:hypothetical protein
MEVSCQIHAAAALPPAEVPQVPIGWEAGWAPEQAWTTWRRENSRPYRDSNHLTKYVIVGFLHALCFETSSADLNERIALDLSDATVGNKSILNIQQMLTKSRPNSVTCALMDRMLFKLNPLDASVRKIRLQTGLPKHKTHCQILLAQSRNL